MANSVSGSFSAGVNLTTVFDSTGTGGTASEINNLATGSIDVGPTQAVPRQFTEQWSKVYTNLAAPVTLDLTALTGIGSRAVVLPALRVLFAINADPTAGHDVQIGPGASTGLATPFPGTAAYVESKGGMTGAGAVGNNLLGNPTLLSNCSTTGWVIDSTHKTITLTPVGTVTSFKIVLAG
jgi:hypothetical protein